MKYIQYLKIAIFIAVFIPGTSYCQDLAYKSDGNVLNINIISIKDGTIVYNLTGNTSGKRFYLSTTLIDSLKYRDGRSMVFTHEDLKPAMVKRNYIGIDLVETFLKFYPDFHLVNNPHISYEHIFKSGKTGFSVEFLLSLNSPKDGLWMKWEGNWTFWEGGYFSYEPFKFLTKVGFNTYPFNYSLIRTGRVRFCTGGSLLLGSVYKYYYNYNPPDEVREVFMAGLVWNIDAKIYLSDALQIKIGLDASVIPLLVFCSPELGITLSF